MVESDDVAGYWLSVCSHDKMTIEQFNGRMGQDDRTSGKHRTEMWQKPTNMRDCQFVTEMH